jgi:predicted phage tail protein
VGECEAGISSTISPTTKAATGTDANESFALSGPTNIDAQGYPVPLVIGEVITGGIPVSSGYDIEDIAAGT